MALDTAEKDDMSENKDSELIIFLKKAQAGEYAEINRESLPYLRYKILPEPTEEQYFYSIR